MFCSECGTKNKEGSLFCESCGHKLEQPVVIEKIKKEPVKKESKVEKVKNSKRKYLILGLIVILIGTYIFLNSITSPKKIAEGYFEAVIDMNTDKIYDYINIEDSEFTTKEKFKEALGDSIDSDLKIVNYNVGKVEFSADKLSASVTISYVEKDTNTTESITIQLVKEKKKKWLFFDNWKVSSGSSTTVSNFEFRLPKGSELKIEDTIVSSKYLDKDDDTLDTYVIPTMFATDYTVKIKLPMGIDVEEEVSIGYYSYYTVNLSEDNISDEIKTNLVSISKKALENLYNNAKENKSWDDVKSTFESKDLDTSSLESSYKSLISSLNYYSTKLSTISFTDIELNDISISEEGYLTLSIKATYDYTVSYDSGGETKTNSSNDYDYMYLTFDYQDEEYKLVDATSLSTYFSRYY